MHHLDKHFMLQPQQTLSCYKTERPLSCEQKEKQTDKISPTSKVCQGATKMAGLLLAFSAALFLAASANPITYEQEGHLRILNAENNVLEAVFFTGATGIRIYGDSSSIVISSLSDGEELIAGSAGDSSKLYRVVGSNFFQETTTDENGELRKVRFVLPESLVNQAKEDIQTRKQQRITSRLTEQSETEVRTAQQQAFQRLFIRQEIQLIEPAAKALGRVGVIGHENQGALNFYGVAIAITKYQHQGESGDGSGDEGNGMVNRRYRRNKRYWGTYKWCDYSWSYCVTGSCTPGYPSCYDKCTDWKDCVGRCGPGCWDCWWYACASCCYRQGCYDHDICCGIYGYISTECLIPIPFSCSSYSC